MVTAGVIRKIPLQRRSAELRLEQVDLVQKENDASSHEPSGVDNGVEEDEALYHAILCVCKLNCGQVSGKYPPDCSLRVRLGRTRSEQRRK